MARILIRLLFALLLVVAPISALYGQGIRVALDVTEETGGIFESHLRTALGRIPDVTVVYGTEGVDYVLRVVVLCIARVDGDCRDASGYAVSTEIGRPLHPDFLITIASTYADSVPEHTKTVLRIMGRGLEYHQYLSVNFWGRDRYELAIREYVAKLDARCFEYARLRKRYDDYRLSEEERAAAERRLRERANDWLCTY